MCSCMVSEVPTVSVVFNYKVPGVPTMSGVPKVSMVSEVTGIPTATILQLCQQV